MADQNTINRDDLTVKETVLKILDRLDRLDKALSEDMHDIKNRLTPLEEHKIQVERDQYNMRWQLPLLISMSGVIAALIGALVTLIVVL